MSVEYKEIPGLADYFASNTGEIFRNWYGEMRKRVSMDNKYGYLKLNIRGKTHKVHQLVANTWIGRMPDGLTVNHIDGNKHNNSPDNLEYVTYAENSRHAHDIGLCRGRMFSYPMQKVDRYSHPRRPRPSMPKGERSKHARLTQEQADCMRIKNKGGSSVRELAREFGVSTATVQKILKGLRYA